MTDIEKKVILQRINEEINQLKVRINNIIEDGISKDAFLTNLDKKLFPSLTLNQNGTAPLGGAVPEIKKENVEEYLKSNFSYLNEYILKQTKALFEYCCCFDITNLNTAYAIIVSKTALFNNITNGKKIFNFKNKDIQLSYKENTELAVGFSFNINFDWYQRSLTKYCTKMGYDIPSITFIEYNPNLNK
jgi:hypothetical protein